MNWEGYISLKTITWKLESFDFDYFDTYQTNKKFSMLERLDLLLREKTGDYSNQIINHDNAATIVITPNNTHEKTVKKLQHGSEIVWSLVKEGLIDFDCTSPIWELSEQTHSIIIQLCRGEAILWLIPKEKRTTYQNQELSRIINNFQPIKEKGYNLEIIASICDNLSSYEIEYSEFLNTDNMQKRTP